jgi:hypothetical protein
MNKLSLVGMQLPEKYKENFDVSSEGPSSGLEPVLDRILLWSRYTSLATGEPGYIISGTQITLSNKLGF